MDLTLLSSLRACRPFKTQIKSEFLRSPNNNFVTLCVSDDQKYSKIQISELESDPFIISCVSDD